MCTGLSLSYRTLGIENIKVQHVIFSMLDDTVYLSIIKCSIKHVAYLTHVASVLV